MNTLTINKSYLATNLSFTDDKMVVYFEDGRELAIPLEWFPKLRNATTEQLKNAFHRRRGRNTLGRIRRGCFCRKLVRINVC